MVDISQDELWAELDKLEVMRDNLPPGAKSLAMFAEERGWGKTKARNRMRFLEEAGKVKRVLANGPSGGKVPYYIPVSPASPRAAASPRAVKLEDGPKVPKVPKVSGKSGKRVPPR